MSDRLDELGADVEVVLIMFGHGAFERYDDRQVSYPVLLDVDRTVYRSYGLGRGSFRAVWGWSTVVTYASIIRRGGRSRLAAATEDTRQLAGDFVVAPDGTLSWGFWGRGPADRPSVDDLIAALLRCSSP